MSFPKENKLISKSCELMTNSRSIYCDPLVINQTLSGDKSEVKQFKQGHTSSINSLQHVLTSFNSNILPYYAQN